MINFIIWLMLWVPLGDHIKWVLLKFYFFFKTEMILEAIWLIALHVDPRVLLVCWSSITMDCFFLFFCILVFFVFLHIKYSFWIMCRSVHHMHTFVKNELFNIVYLISISSKWLQLHLKSDNPVGCTTKGGKDCIFPFQRNGVTYTKCSDIAFETSSGTG